MGFLDKFRKKGKYNTNPEDNVPRFVYGVPDVTKYDVEPDENVPREVYGIPSPSKYDVNPNDNIPQKVYGIKVADRNINFDKDIKSVVAPLEKAIIECVGTDPFWSELIRKYFVEDVKYDDNTAVELLKSVAKDKEIFNEFTRYLTKKSYDLDFPIKLDGMTAKDLASKYPQKTAIEVYVMLSELKNK